MNKKIKLCKGGDHDLVDIYKETKGIAEHVVRWCENCGAIVIDIDFDGRTNPGGVMEMEFPKITKNLHESCKKK